MTEHANPHHGSTLNDFLQERGMLEEFRAAAIKEALAFQHARRVSGKLEKPLKT